MDKKISWRTFFNAIVVLLTVIMVGYFCFSDGGLIDLMNSNSSINIFWLCVAILSQFLNIFMDVVLIYIFIKESTPRFKFSNAFRVSMAGQFFCAVTPSSTGGQPMQIAMLNTMNINIGKATSALVQKFLVWELVLMAYSIMAVCLKFSFISASMGSGVVVLSAIGFLVQIALCSVLLMVSFAKKITQKIVNFAFRLIDKIHIIKNTEEKKQALENQLETFHSSNKELYKNRPLVIKAVVLTFIQISAYLIVPYFVGRALNINSASPVDMLFVQAFVNMISSLMPLPGGSGVAEFCFTAFFSGYFSTSTIKSAVLIWRTITYYGTIFFCAPFSGMSRKKDFENTQDARQ